MPPSDLPLRAIYERSAHFVWFSLQRLGVRHPDLEDLRHDVFIIAHRKLPEFDGRTQVNAWLFGICLRVVANYRRRAYIRLEEASGDLAESDEAVLFGSAASDSFDSVARREAEAEVERILELMPLTKRAVFTMFEFEGMACEEIAARLGVPVGTIYSRLHAARQFFTQEAKQQHGSDETAIALTPTTRRTSDTSR